MNQNVREQLLSEVIMKLSEKKNNDIKVIERIDDFEVIRFKATEGGITNEIIDKLIVPKEQSLKEAFNSDNFTPFISALQRRSQSGMDKMMKNRFDSMLKTVQKKMKRKAKGLRIKKTKYEIKKAIHRDNEMRIQQRMDDFGKIVENVKANAENIAAKYEGANFDVTNGLKSATLKDGTFLKFDTQRFKFDSMIEVFDKYKDLSENELWEIYGEVAEKPTEVKDGQSER